MKAASAFSGKTKKARRKRENIKMVFLLKNIKDIILRNEKKENKRPPVKEGITKIKAKAGSDPAFAYPHKEKE